MHLCTLSLTNFRNYKSQTLSCDERANLFLGQNGQGKTNLLEAIYYLCVARSCREAMDKELISIGDNFFLVKGIGVSSVGRDVELEIRYARYAGKKVLVNEQPQRNVSDLFGSMAAVVMSPDDRRLIQGSPGCRRRFLDIAIAQTSPAYLATLQDYRRVVKQRNEALRQYQMKVHNPPDLGVWDSQLIMLGSQIMKKRQDVIARLHTEAQALHHKISDAREELKMEYSPSFSYEDQENIAETFQAALSRTSREEKARGVTVVGPHRDDIKLSIDGVMLSTYGSQGQHKTAATAMKMSEAVFIQNQIETPPLLLLDDIFAELDATRTARLIELLPSFGQVFITAAKESDIGNYGKKFRQFHVQAGTVTPKAEREESM